MIYEWSHFALKTIGSYSPEWAVFYWGCQSVCALQPWITSVTFNWSLCQRESKCKACTQTFNSPLVSRSKIFKKFHIFIKS